MHLYVLPSLFALFAWWFSTGVIIYLDGLPRHTFSSSFAFLSLLMFLSLCGLVAARDDASVGGAYLSFAAGLTVWGWQIAGFYMGIVTGPRKHACPQGCRGPAHFWHAVEACLYHELAALAGAVALCALTWGSPNQIGAQTYLLLWLLHECAKLNVFFGARNLNEEYLPEHMRYLSSFFSRRPINSFFPFSVTAGTAAMVLAWQAAFAPTARPFDAVGNSFLGCMAALGLVELWLLVLPLPLHLWDWGLRSHREGERDGEARQGMAGAERI